jgi:hypothetical protein
MRGVFLGPVHESNPHNRKGNRENQKLVDLNTAILRHNHAEWDRPPAEPLIWNASHSCELEHLVSSYNAVNAPFWGFKDPRTLLTLRFWLSRIEKAKYVGTVRHPLLVARSLESRNGFDINQGLILWLAYNTILLNLLKEKHFPVISFDVDEDEYNHKINYIARELGLMEVSTKDTNFYSEDLLNHRCLDGYKLPDIITKTYESINARTV